MSCWIVGALSTAVLFLGCFMPSQGETQTQTLLRRKLSTPGAASAKRKLQIIILDKNYNGEDTIFDPSIFKKDSGSGSGASTKSGGTATCRAPKTWEDGNGGYTVEETETIQVTYEYEVETSSPTESADSAYVQNTIPLAVDYATVGALGDKLCAEYECMISFALGTPPDSIILGNTAEYCQEKQGIGGSCFPYDGGIRVKFSTEGNCTKEEIEATVINVLKGSNTTGANTGAMSQGNFIKEVNEYVEVIKATGGGAGGGGGTSTDGGTGAGTGAGTGNDGGTGAGTGNDGGTGTGAGNDGGTGTGAGNDGGTGTGNGNDGGTGTGDGNDGGTGTGPGNDGEEVTFVRIVGGDGNGAGGGGVAVAGIAGTPEMLTEDDGFSPLAWALLALVLLLLLLCCFVWRRYRRAEQDSLNRMEEDMKSVKTDWSGMQSRGDKTYVTADLRNLAGQHSKLDVHKCKSAVCEVCSPSLGKVFMIKVTPSRRPGSIPPSMLCREVASTPKQIDDDVEDAQEEDEPDEHEPITAHRDSSFLSTEPDSTDHSATPEDKDGHSDDVDSIRASFYETRVPSRRNTKPDEGDHSPKSMLL